MARSQQAAHSDERDEGEERDEVRAARRADRAVGAVLVSAAGDALGAGYEFGPPLADDVPVVMAGGGAFGWAPGEWTDDTQMAVAVLGAIADGGDVLDEVERAFRRWFRSGPADVGMQTRAVLGRPGRLADIAAAHAAANPSSSAGNGSLMRTGSVALARLGDPAGVAELAADVSRLTHADPDCVDACVLWSVAIDDAIRHAPPPDQPWGWDEALVRALDHLAAGRRDLWRQRIAEAAAGVPGDFPRNGWVVHAFQAALAAICRAEDGSADAEGHLVRALEGCVRAGGDTDTVAAIAGALLGARHGAAAVPEAWVELLHGRRTYDEPVLDADDLAELARTAAGRDGQPDPPRCAACGGRLVPIAYGLPGPDMIDDAEAGLVVLGGCMIDDHLPTAQCTDCGATTGRFGDVAFG